jgi:pyruvate/2-oxoglutarate dehydrogenase complex dihydrolipoamide dehydrogenase (E3) component
MDIVNCVNESEFDAIVIGAGQAGPPLAGRLTGAGMKVALVERALFGGTCVNTGCTPTKTLVASARVAHLARRARDYGVTVDGTITVDLARVKARAQAVVDASRVGIEEWLRNMRGCTVMRGQAAFESPTQVRVGDEVLSAPRVFINVGGRASVPRIPGVGEVSHLDNSSILRLDHVPEHLVVVGGSYVGLELAQIFRRFGSAVTVVEMQPHLIPREDPDVSTAVEGILRGEGIAVRTSAKCIGFGPHPRGVVVRIVCTEGEPAVAGSHLLLAVGRRPNTDDLGLERAGVATDARGFVTVDDTLATSTPGIWALGDCNGRGAFTHTAYNDFEIVAANLLDGANRRVTDRIPAYALYVDPPLGRVGMTETAALASGRPLLRGNRPMTRVGRAVEKGETQGFMKVVADAATRQILGAAILGVGGDEAIHGLVDMMNVRATLDSYVWAVPIHPTVSELIPTVLGDMKPVSPGA